MIKRTWQESAQAMGVLIIGVVLLASLIRDHQRSAEEVQGRRVEMIASICEGMLRDLQKELPRLAEPAAGQHQQRAVERFQL